MWDCIKGHTVSGNNGRAGVWHVDQPRIESVSSQRRCLYGLRALACGDSRGGVCIGWAAKYPEVGQASFTASDDSQGNVRNATSHGAIVDADDINHHGKLQVIVRHGNGAPGTDSEYYLKAPGRATPSS